MSQCHDIYNTIETQGSGERKSSDASLSGAQCHDAHESEVTAPAADVQHYCRFVDRLQDGAHLIRVFGRVDWATAARFGDFMSKATEAEVVIDLSEATIDSAGTGALIGFVTRALKRDQRVVLVTSDQLQHELFAAVDLDLAVPVVWGEPEAFQALGHLVPQTSR
jgi:anti-anti-sigma regulatory factor